MAIYEFEGKRPDIEPTTFVHPQAVIIGGVKLGPGCYVGAGAVLRGDWGDIVVGEGSNIQENCVVHAGPGERVILGPSSHIGHGAILHGVTLGIHVLVGMGAILNDNVEVGDGSLIGAGSILLEGMKVPPGKLVLGVPARIMGDLTEKLRKANEWGTKLYQGLPPRCHSSMRRLD